MANQEIRDVVFNLQVRTEDGKVKIEGLTRGFVKAETAMKRMKDAVVESNEAIKTLVLFQVLLVLLCWNLVERYLMLLMVFKVWRTT